MIAVVNDANILIDLVKLEIEAQFFALNMAFHTTNLVLGELSESQLHALQPYVLKNSLKVYTCSAEDMLVIGEWQSQRSALSTQDCSALWLAKQYNSILLTSDNKLRKTAKSERIDVHGHLWIFDQLADSGLLTTEMSTGKLIQLCEQINPKLGLPAAEIQKRIRGWEI